MNIQVSLTVFKALSDSSRLLIVSSLRQKPQYVEELAQRLSLAESTVSFHLKKLETAGLVYKEKQQYYVVFHLNEHVFDATLKELVSFANPLSETQDKRIEEYRKKVISTFFQEGVLTKLPSQYKKKLIILEEILQLFHTDRIYTEKEVDEILKPVVEDYVSIRRFFIDEKMMTRNAGIYKITVTDETTLSGSLLISGSQKQVNKIFSKYSEEKKIKMANLKEINRALKEVLPPMGVYIIHDKEHDTIYLGSNRNMRAIFNRHRMELETHIHTIKELQDAYDKRGYDAITFEVLDMLEPKEEKGFDYTEDIQTLEELWCSKFREENKAFFLLKATSLAK
jgi:predicted transcriptional regulator